MIQVLLVEDDVNVSRIITYYLAKEDMYDVKRARTFSEAICMSADRFDIILLDIMLPDGNGITLCDALRERHHCPIIFISCLNDNNTIISALAAGGDDYISKPFDNRILHARIKACLRRVSMDKMPVKDNIIRYHEYSLDLDKHVFLIGDRSISLMHIEFRILAFLMQNHGRCFNSEAIYKAIWEDDSAGDTRTVVVHIYNLRKCIEINSKDPQIIRNIWGKGYCFDPDGLISE